MAKPAKRLLGIYLFLLICPVLLSPGCKKAPSPTSKPAPPSNAIPRARIPADGRSRHMVYNLAINQEALGNIALSSDGLYACTISQTGGPGKEIRHDIIRVWDLRDPAVAQEIASLDPIDGIQAGGNSTSILFDPEYTRLLFTRDDHTSIGFWDFSSGQLEILRLPSQFVKDGQTGDLLAIESGWRAISAGGGDNAANFGLCVWDLSHKKLLTRLDNASGISAAGFVPAAETRDGDRLLGTDKNGALHIWSSGSWKHLFTFKIPAGNNTQLIFAPDGKTFYCGGRLHGALAPGSYQKCQVSDDSTRAAFSWRGDLLAVGERPDSIAILYSMSASRLRTLRGCSADRGLAFTTDGRYLISSSDTSIHRWNLP